MFKMVLFQQTKKGEREWVFPRRTLNIYVTN